MSKTPTQGPTETTEMKAAKYDRIVAELVANNRWIILRSCEAAIEKISLIIDPEGKVGNAIVQVWE